ncbi:MAG: hypothetical protein KDM91_00505 [Verrucomicrobiae bacterium]|nr:hypothetical protein [Verrucomicrobiae bacterium]
MIDFRGSIPYSATVAARPGSGEQPRRSLKKMSQVAIGAPGGYRRLDPSPSDIRPILQDSTNCGTPINDVGMTASNGLNGARLSGTIFRNLMFHLRAIDEVTVIHESTEMDDWIANRASSKTAP